MSNSPKIEADITALRDRFAISPMIDLEIDICGEGWVGLASGASDQLRKNLMASVIAEKLGYASVDYVRKTYLSDLEPHRSSDFNLREMGTKNVGAYEEFYRSFQPPRKDAPLGVFAFDLTMVRARSALELLLVLARQGFLIEACLVARGVLEQLAYAVHVHDKLDDKDVFDVKPQALIKGMTGVCSSAGKAYGFLSKLSHYDPKMHYHFIGDEAGETVNQRSWKFKIISSAWAFYMFYAYFEVFSHMYRKYDNYYIVENLGYLIKEHFMEYFDGVDSKWVEQVRGFINN